MNYMLKFLPKASACRRHSPTGTTSENDISTTSPSLRSGTPPFQGGEFCLVKARSFEPEPSPEMVKIYDFETISRILENKCESKICLFSGYPAPSTQINL
jgi:hypothetical protein